MSIVSDLRKQVAEATAKIEEIQATCTHPATVVTKHPTQLPVTVFYEDDFGGQQGTEWRNGFKCACGLCEKAWTEYADGRPYSQFDTEQLGRI